jgi:aminomethyltransferase
LEKVLKTFDHYIIMDDVEVTNVSETLAAIGIAGPRATEVLAAAGLELPELQPLELIDLKWQHAELTVVRSDNPSIVSFELWLAPAHLTPVWEASVKAGAKPAGTTALNLLRIASGIPRYGEDIRERDLPQETEQQRALHFSKGCYIGQEIVERIRSRGNVHRKFTGFVIDGALPAPGSKIQTDGKDAGEITSAASLPAPGGGHLVALGYLRREIALPGRQIEIGSAKATVANLPFEEIFKN